jgi:hypothetical protein
MTWKGYNAAVVNFFTLINGLIWLVSWQRGNFWMNVRTFNLRFRWRQPLIVLVLHCAVRILWHTLLRFNYFLRCFLVIFSPKFLLILTSSEHVPPVNVGIPHCGGVDKHHRWCRRTPSVW